MTFELFTVPAGTKIAQLPNGLLVFAPPDEHPFTVEIVMDSKSGRVTVVKTTIAPDCACEVTIGSSNEKAALHLPRQLR